MDAKSDVVRETLGQWGKWQRRSVFLIFLCKIPSCWCMAIIIFTAPSPKQVPFMCFTSTAKSLTLATSNVSERHQLKLVYHPTLVEPKDKQFDIPYCDAGVDLLDHINRYDRSTTSSLRIEDVANVNGTLSLPCDSLIHKPFYYLKETAFDVVCSRNFVAAFTQFFHLFGVVSGGLIAMALMAFVSPKYLMLYGMMGQIICGFSLAFIDDFQLQLAVRLLCSISCAQMYSAGAVIFSDITDGKYRTYVTCLFDTFWSIGVITMPIISYFAQSWRNTYMAITIPTCVYVLLWYFIGDSPTWHIQKGNYDRATRILLEAATTNEHSQVIRTDLYAELREPRKKMPRSRGIWSLMWNDRRILLNVICIHVAWGVFVTNVNGLFLNTRAFSTENLLINVIMTGCSELIGVFFGLSCILESSRKWHWVGLLNISAGLLVLLLSNFYKGFADNNTIFVISAALLVKAITSTSQVLLLSSTGELVAAEHRKSLLMSCTVWGRTCLLTASFIGSLTLVSAIRPFVVFSLMGTVAGLALCILDPRVVQPKGSNPLISVEMEDMSKTKKIEVLKQDTK